MSQDRETEYLFFEVTYNNCLLDYNTTICRTINDVRDAIRLVETDLDDIKADASVTIRGIGMTNAAYDSWCEENGIKK